MMGEVALGEQSKVALDPRRADVEAGTTTKAMKRGGGGGGGLGARLKQCHVDIMQTMSLTLLRLD